MRVYPRIVYKESAYLKVSNEAEEMAAAKEGYESHKSPEIVAKRKGTDREILRAKVEETVEITEEEQVKEEEVKEVKPKQKSKAK